MTSVTKTPATNSFKVYCVNQGKAYTAIEPGTDLNDLCVVPKSGMMFMATESPKVLTYYIPVSFYINQILQMFCLSLAGKNIGWSYQLKSTLE